MTVSHIGFETLALFRTQYGDVIGMYLGKTPCILISDAELIQEAMAKDAFADRPNPGGASLVR